jgi:hypothetical protein
MFYSNTYKNRETAQRLICCYDLFSQIIRLKKAVEQTNVLVFNVHGSVLRKNILVYV